MTTPFDQLDRLRRDGGVAAMATLVAAKGTTPKKAGARMWVGRDGAILGSVTIGGCVDARVVSESDRVLARGGAALLDLSLGDEEAWEIGLTCGGRVEVLVERVDARDGDPIIDAYDAARAEVDAGRAAVVVAPLHGAPGRLVVGRAGAIAGSLGDAAVDAAAEAAALPLLDGSASAVLEVSVGPAVHRLYFELLRPAETVVVYGAGEVAMSLAVIARELGMRTIVVDGRERYATRARFPQADEIMVGMPSEIAERLPAGAATYVVLVAHDYKYELPVLRHVLRGDAAYVGMLGSRKRGAAVKDMLREEGFTDDELARIHTPIGLDIGARSAAEIALAIAAEIVAVREHARVRRRTEPAA